MAETDTKSLVMATAIDLFAQHGYEKTTMRAIARNVGIQSSSIYYFFDSKESLLNAIFSEFESNFAKYRNPPEVIWKASKEKPLSEVLGMMFYKFGDSVESKRMMTISRVILSLQYENVGAQELFEKVFIKEAIEYGICVLEGLFASGVIIEVDFKWLAFTFHSFATAVFQETLRNLKPFTDSNRDFEEGIRFICGNFAEIIKRKD